MGLAVLSAGLLFASGTAVPFIPANHRVTEDHTPGSYTRSDGGADSVTRACSTGRVSQNEASVAVDPRRPDVVVSGANDLCPFLSGASIWVGYYRSTDAGRSWHDSLVPGYRGDASSAGGASPARRCRDASDPAQAFDAHGRLAFAFVCTAGPAKQLRSAIMAATYDRDGSHYAGAAVVHRSAGVGFEDKPALTVDATGGRFDGTIYVVWTEFLPDGCGNVLLSRSTDHGATFSNAVVPSGPGCGGLADVAVAPDGSVDVAFASESSIQVATSTDGGRTFSRPAIAAQFTPFTSSPFGGGFARECGDGPAACGSGFTFARFAAAPTVAVDASGLHVAYSAVRPGGQGKIEVASSLDGRTWPRRGTVIDTVPVGHQWFPDMASADGVLDLVFYDSRADPVYSPDRPPGNDAGGHNVGPVVGVFLATSSDGGASWVERRLSSNGSNPNLETRDAGKVPFFGDYLSVSAVPGAAYAAWTDTRDVVLGEDARENGDSDADGFDVYLPCRWQPNDVGASRYRSPSAGDPCLRQGGLDQNVYEARLP